MRGGHRILDHDGAAGELDRPGTLRAIRPLARQDDRDEVLSERGGGRLHQPVHRWPWAAAARLFADANQVVRDDHVAVGGDDVDDARLELLLCTDAPDLHGRSSGEDLLEVARSTRVKMLGDDHRGRERLIEPADEDAERVDAARGGSDDDDLRYACLRHALDGYASSGSRSPGSP